MDSKTCPDCGYIAYYDSYFKAIVCRQCGYHHILDPLEDYRKLSSIEQLNYFRNLHYKDGENTESRIIADALNEILPKYASLTEARSKKSFLAQGAGTKRIFHQTLLVIIVPEYYLIDM